MPDKAGVYDISGILVSRKSYPPADKRRFKSVTAALTHSPGIASFQNISAKYARQTSGEPVLPIDAPRTDK